MKSGILLIICLIILSDSAFGQDKINRIFFDLGINYLSNKETHFTSNFRDGVGSRFEIGFERKTPKSINRFSLLGAHTNTGNDNISRSITLQPELRYTHLRSISNKGFQLGGYLDAGTLLNFRQGVWSNENGTNYTIWSSLGLSTQFDKKISFGNRELNWITQFSIPILSYLIRPSYTFPYTDNFLENEVFNFERSGLGEKIITGGSLALLNNFFRPQFQTGFSFSTKNKNWEFGLKYAFDYLQTQEVKPVFQTRHQLSLTSKLTK